MIVRQRIIEFVKCNVIRLLGNRSQLVIRRIRIRYDVREIKNFICSTMDCSRQVGTNVQTPTISQPVARKKIGFQTGCMVVQRYGNLDVTVHNLIQRDADLHQAVAQINRIGDILRQFHRDRRRRNHLGQGEIDILSKTRSQAGNPQKSQKVPFHGDIQFATAGRLSRHGRRVPAPRGG